MVLSRVVEPGDPDAATLVAAHGAEALVARLADAAQPDSLYRLLSARYPSRPSTAPDAAATTEA